MNKRRSVGIQVLLGFLLGVAINVIMILAGFLLSVLILYGSNYHDMRLA